MSSGPSVIRKSGGGNNRSNLELLNSLRDNFSEAKRDYAAASNAKTNRGAVNGNDSLNGNGIHGGTCTPPPTPVEVWTERDGEVLYIPRINWQAAGLRDDANQYEITVKLFLLPGTSVAERGKYVREVLALVGKELGTQTIDLLVASFPGISFEGTCEWEADKKNAHQGNLNEELATWKTFEDLHNQGVVKRLGVAEFGSEKLSAFIKQAVVPPVVDQINLQDCCNVPPPLKKLAGEHGIELNVHRDCTDILPRGTLRELLGSGVRGANVLADEESGGVGLQGNIVPQWVVRYMAFVRDRGVIENKGYFAGAELVQGGPILDDDQVRPLKAKTEWQRS
jgi:glutamate--cysteine ligase regulatory subunit